MSKLEIVTENSPTRRRVDALLFGELFSNEPCSSPMMRIQPTPNAPGCLCVSLADGIVKPVAAGTMVVPITATLTIK